MGVCKLPFIEEETLLGATKALLKELQPDEIESNCVKSDKVFFMDSNSLIKKISLQHQLTENHHKGNHDAVNPRFGINGFLSSPTNFISPILGMNDISNDTTRCATLIKQELESHPHRPLEGVIIPEKTITDSDIVERLLWHEYSGHYPPQPLQQRDVHPLREVAKEASKGVEEGWRSVGRRKLVLDSSLGSSGVERGKVIVDRVLVGSNKEMWKGGGRGWGGVGRGKAVVDQVLVGSSKEMWKGGGRGWGGVGRGRLIVLDREQKPYPGAPATHMNVKDNKGSNRRTYGWGECSAVVPAYPVAPATHLNVKDNKGSNRSTYGWGECSAAVPASSKFYGDSVKRADDWRQRSASMVSAYGRGMKTPAPSSHGRQDSHSWKGD